LFSSREAFLSVIPARFVFLLKVRVAPLRIRKRFYNVAGYITIEIRQKNFTNNPPNPLLLWKINNDCTNHLRPNSSFPALLKSLKEMKAIL
jgi:hypothetical protein